MDNGVATIYLLHGVHMTVDDDQVSWIQEGIDAPLSWRTEDRVVFNVPWTSILYSTFKPKEK